MKLHEVMLQITKVIKVYCQKVPRIQYCMTFEMSDHGKTNKYSCL